EILQQVIAIVRGMWQKRWIAMGVAWLVTIVGMAGVYRVPERYEATARVFVDTQTVLKPLMSGLAVQPDINQQLEMLARTLISRPNVEQLLNNADSRFAGSDSAERDRRIDELIAQIKILGGGRENLYAITYRDTDRERAGRIVQGLVSLFVSSGVGEKKRDSEEARKFIEEQIASYEKKLSESEERLKEFKLRNFGYTGAAQTDYFGRMSTLNEELQRSRTELRSAEQSRDALKRELAGEEPVLLATPNGGGSGTVSELDGRIESQKKQLDEMLRRYTEEHPDVVGTRRLIAQLEEQKRRELDLRAQSGVGQRINAATNPVFQQIKIALADAEAKVASLRARSEDIAAQLSTLRASANRVPQVEAELAQLNRDYEVIKRNYEQLVGRREAALISKDVDSSQRLAEFRVIEPPRVSPRPVFPNRASLTWLVLAAAVGAGVFAAFALSQVFPTFQDARALRQLAQRPVLGAVSLQITPRMRSRERREMVLFGASLAGLLATHVMWVVWLSLPLNI
ncbi:MAG TPA: XrtA system polysaccharide chain length determinant, partial [Burkholderiaceae bacterium]|nr:XrtA system polysaccharide chain length determinant [Burkholderiaceae bacterium]